MQAPRDRSGGAGAAERVEHEIVGPGRGENHAGEQRFGFLRRVQLLAVVILEPFLAGA